MMYYLNRDDIDVLVEVIEQRHPAAYPFARYLRDWRDWVDDHSDGWPYWSGGCRAAGKLMHELEGIRRGLPINLSALRKALAPIRATCTRHKWTGPIFQS